MSGARWVGARPTDVLRLLAFALALLLISVATVAVDWGAGQRVVQEGQAADQTIKSPVTMTFDSDLRTQDRRQQAYDDDANIARTYDEAIRQEQVAAVSVFLDHVEAAREDRTGPESERVADIRSALEGLSEQDANHLLELQSAAWQRVRSEVVRIVDDTLADPIEADQVQQVREQIPGRVSAMLTQSEQLLAATIAMPYVRATIFIDEEQTLVNRQAAAADVQPVPVNVLSGQAIVRDGDIVTEYDIEKLEQLGLLQQGQSVAERLGKTGLMAILTLCLVTYIARFQRQVWQSRQLLLVSLTLLGPIIMGRLILPHDEIQYMFPIAASAMLLAVLLDFQIAAIVATFASLYLGIVADMSLELAVIYFVGAIAGAFVICHAERTITFVWAGLTVAVATFATAWCFHALSSGMDSSSTAELLIESAVNGILSASLTFLSFSLIGSILGITTHLQLLELAHPNQPLLYRLAREAPGTYHHSIVVSNLAEAGVEIVGGDPLFARVAVLYHDIGKIVRPTFFIENQANLENPHDLLDPRVSARVIIDHVIDGSKLARKARLPQPIVDVIEQHHGTSLIRYFFVKCRDNGEAVDEAEFRYPGPKPQTKETGVIMLADSIEATTRASAGAGRLANARSAPGDQAESLESIVDRIIKERLDDGQLDDCDLTLREIGLIRNAFVQILEGIYHPRVEYPPLRLEQPVPAPVSPATS